MRPFSAFLVLSALALLASAVTVGKFQHDSAEAKLLSTPEPAIDQPHAPLAVPSAHDGGSARVSVEAGSGLSIPPSELAAALDAYASAERELLAAQRRVRFLEAELAALGAGTGPIASWVQHLPPEQRPAPSLVQQLFEVLDPYPIAFQPAELDWIAERIVRQDWREAWPSAGTVDEALIQFLGPERIAREVPADKLEYLKAEEPAYFH